MMDIHQILKQLPHRYPILLVDRVLEIEKGQRIKALKNISINEPQFTGHFPHRPVFPGVLMLEAMAQTAALLAFDTGPANAPINDLLQARLGRAQDEGGALAATGQVDETAVARFLDHPYFFKMPPKSLDRNEFHAALQAVDALTPADAAATLTAIAAASVARGAEHFPRPVTRLLVTGGGRHNATMMRELATRLSCPVEPVEAAGLNGDMLEAQAFAYLAVCVMRGLPTSCPTTTGVPAAVGGGQISRPSRR